MPYLLLQDSHEELVSSSRWLALQDLGTAFLVVLAIALVCCLC